MDYDKFFQTIVNSATLGSTYALIALGYTMVYGILKLLNFAHGDVFMVGAYVGFGVLTAVRRRDRPVDLDLARARRSWRSRRWLPVRCSAS